MKILFIALFLVAGITAYEYPEYCPPEAPHSLTVGNCEDEDKMTIAASISTNPSVHSYFNIPRDSQFEKPIVCIKINDREPNNEGGCPEILYGGIGQNYVQIHFLPQFGSKMLYDIYVYIAKD